MIHAQQEFVNPLKPIMVIADSRGTKEWRIRDKSKPLGYVLHRNGAPARTRSDGSEEWIVLGKYHRVGGPAVTWITDKTIKWYFNDRLHREDGPALIKSDGTLTWFKHGVCHRDNNKPAIIFPCGKKMWYTNGQQYREDGPAIVTGTGTKEWNDDRSRRHREDGPAIEYSNGKYGWFFRDKEMSFEKWAVKMELAFEEIVKLKLIYV